MYLTGVSHEATTLFDNGDAKGEADEHKDGEAVVGDGAGEDEEAGEDEGVAVEDPLQTGETSVEVVLNGGQSDVDDGDVHAQDEHAEAADREDEIGVGRRF